MSLEVGFHTNIATQLIERSKKAGIVRPFFVTDRKQYVPA